ncbi:MULTISPECIES: glucose-1-phosphate adenylyltransferase [Geobacillus]|jgi:glucose-1-phosphate adenylyltransferase|uniref:glucose-1-phosphate adenylyltransferase n=1 Tax=Geobacillus TaxID=129337 RepID=UPI0004A444E9|nr:glucose-1-phosphate adenylyltransferase [Geobacillus thermodenitrificans]ARA98721.1 glucose-1-phosphate adenylyltransferase [Geobacillus thermodenitrificans]ATO38075.1 glucose-1-phosphate adenylyltransferase [Geobacillus thermodenitrificans]MED0662926.1 glucose-1-phosphate adenylyltransferase [Geobacillus thermodenitrificans]
MKKKCIAMLLAGGQGSRLRSLTTNIAKPAVPFGGKYRIIDFTLSNCTNSGIDTVGVLTQYQPLLLHSYIGIGSAWDLDRRNGGVTVLPPYSVSSGVKWYEGTANAVYQNINYIEQYNPDYVLVLSGDHIYKMDYQHMLDYHIAKQADVTISVIEVPWEEASRFGIMNTNEEMEIVEFAEKPAEPKSNLASMGIYIFNWPLLKQYLQIDNVNPHSSHDFGKDVIPMLLREKKRLFAYPFEGYWKDVGTVKSLWEANMDLLDENNELDLFDRSWRIYSVNPNQPPQYISPEAEVSDSLVNEGCVVEGTVERSVLFQGVRIGKGAVVKESVIMPGAAVSEGAYVERAIVTPDSIIPPHSSVCPEDADDVVLVTAEWLKQSNEETARKDEA